MSHYYCVYIVVVPYIVIIVVFVVVCRFVYLFYWQFKLVTGFWVIANKKLTHSHAHTPVSVLHAAIINVGNKNSCVCMKIVKKQQ